MKLKLFTVCLCILTRARSRRRAVVSIYISIFHMFFLSSRDLPAKHRKQRDNERIPDLYTHQLIYKVYEEVLISAVCAAFRSDKRKQRVLFIITRRLCTVYTIIMICENIIPATLCVLLLEQL